MVATREIDNSARIEAMRMCPKFMATGYVQNVAAPFVSEKWGSSTPYLA